MFDIEIVNLNKLEISLRSKDIHALRSLYSLALEVFTIQDNDDAVLLTGGLSFFYSRMRQGSIDTLSNFTLYTALLRKHLIMSEKKGKKIVTMPWGLAELEYHLSQIYVHYFPAPYYSENLWLELFDKLVNEDSHNFMYLLMKSNEHRIDPQTLKNDKLHGSILLKKMFGGIFPHEPIGSYPSMNANFDKLA